jgi:uncharacterized protein
MMGFVFRLIPPRPDFMSTMSEGEHEVMTDHFGYWGELPASGLVPPLGPHARLNSC